MGENYLKRELYNKIKTNDEIFQFLQEAALDGIWYWDLEDLANEWMSPNFWTTLGFDPKEKKHFSSEWQSLIYSSDLKLAKENLKRHIDDPEVPYDQIVRYKHKDGSTVWIRCKGLAVRNEDGKAIRMLGAHIDITELMNSHNSISQLKNEFEKVFNGSQDALFLIEVKGDNLFRFVRNNLSHQKNTGIPLDMIQGKTPQELIGKEAGDEVTKHYQECVNKKDVTTYEESLNLPAGKKLWHTTLTPIISGNKTTYIVGSAVDITERKRMELELERRANYDSLTGLANREYLTRKFETFCEDLNSQFVFIFLDLDKFKEINDGYGHFVGDELLKEVSKRLLNITNEEDFVSRLGGDEFVILKFDIFDTVMIEKFEDELVKLFKKPFNIDNKMISIDISIGYSRFPLDGLDYDKLSRKADKKMYDMKNTHKNS